MKRTLTTLTLPAGLTLLAGLCGCDQQTTSTPTTNGSTTNGSATRAPAPDNTARNKGDAQPGVKTPLDQSNTAEDTRITAEIRRAVVDDSSLSMNGHNCKIITERGVVTLRGPVASQAERDTIEAKAKAVAGVVSVTNQLEIKTP